MPPRISGSSCFSKITLFFDCLSSAALSRCSSSGATGPTLVMLARIRPACASTNARWARANVGERADAPLVEQQQHEVAQHRRQRQAPRQLLQHGASLQHRKNRILQRALELGRMGEGFGDAVELMAER